MNTRFISFADAVKRFNNSLILCNNIVEVDFDIFENVNFEYWVDDEPREIYQYFLTDCSAEDVEYLSKWFGLLFTYSPKLDCYILCVDHWGTSWDSVMIEDNSPII